MNTETIVRAWKDPAFRASLAPEQRAALPDNPSGSPLTDLEESELGDVVGGRPFPVTDPALCCFLTQFCPTFAIACRDLDA